MLASISCMSTSTIIPFSLLSTSTIIPFSLLSTCTISKNPVCDAVRQVYQNSACCGEGGGSAVCVAPSVPSTALGISDCFAAVQSTHAVLPGCESVLQYKQTTRVKNSGTHFAQDDNAYTRYLAATGDVQFVWKKASSLFPNSTSLTSRAETDPFRNFQHSITITPTHLLLGVYDATPKFGIYVVKPSISGVYKLDRDTLQLVDTFIGPPDYIFNVMRYAPVVADNYVFSVNWAYHPNASSTQKGYLYATPYSNFSDFANLKRRDIIADFGVSFGGFGVTGPLASHPSGDAQCGTHIYVGSNSYSYAPIASTNEQNRPLGLNAEELNRGRIGCYCSRTMQPCPSWKNGYYYNGKPGPLPASFDTVQEIHLNRARTDFLGTISQVSCANLTEFKVSRLIPYAFTVTLDESTQIGNVLFDNNRVKLYVLSGGGGGAQSNVYNLTYWGGYYNTPTVGMTLFQWPSGLPRKLLSLNSVVLDMAYSTGIALQPKGTNVDAMPSNALINASIIYSSYATSSFDDTITISPAVVQTCASTSQYAAVKVSGGKYEDFSGMTLKLKYAAGEFLPVGARKSTLTLGSSFWNPCAVEGDILFCPSGNGFMSSFDRQQIFAPVIVLDLYYTYAKIAAINKHDPVALKAAIAGHASVLALNAQQAATLSEFDAHFKEDAVHAIDANTGELLWSTQIEGVDSWFLTLNSLVDKNFMWNYAAISALGAQAYGDYDANGVVVKGDLVYVSTKGGKITVVDKLSGTLLKTHQYAPATVLGAANYGGFCVTASGVAVGHATTNQGYTPLVDYVGPYSWMTQSGTLISNYNSILAAWDPVRDVELWAVEIKGGTSQAGISCVEDRVLAACPEGVGTCNYDAFSGKISQTVIPNPARDANHLFAANTVTSKTKSFICDGPECFAWNDGAYVNKFVMV